MRAPGQAGPGLDALFSYGFRPFFLGAAVFAAVFMTVWLLFVLTVMSGATENWLPVAGSPFAWHAHELVFGFAAAAIAGFLLTAVPNWTGALPLSGTPLFVLFLIWAAGRLGMSTSTVLPYWIAATLDLIFLPVLGAFAALQLFVKPAARNLVFLALLAVMTAINGYYHAAVSGLLEADPIEAGRLGLLIVVTMIAIIGGRIVPAFTHNWLHLNKGTPAYPIRNAGLDVISVVSIVVFAALIAAGREGGWLGLSATVAALANGIRLYLWRGWQARREPIVWILHAGYAWLVIGLAFSALSAFYPAIPRSVTFHAFGVGAAGTMIMAVMSRASLGHTGRPLVAPQIIVWAYLLVNLAAVLRVFGPLALPVMSEYSLAAAGLCWIGAFTLFVIYYAPILMSPRVHTKVPRP